MFHGNPPMLWIKKDDVNHYMRTFLLTEEQVIISFHYGSWMKHLFQILYMYVLVMVILQYFCLCQITEINNLNHLLELRVLNLAGNAISHVRNLQGMDSLTELNLRRNRITTVVSIWRQCSSDYLFNNN